MKIIFDSEQQKEQFDIVFFIICNELCPSHIGVEHNKCRHYDKTKGSCLTCWRNCDIEMEVRDVKLNSDKEETD